MDIAKLLILGKKVPSADVSKNIENLLSFFRYMYFFLIIMIHLELNKIFLVDQYLNSRLLTKELIYTKIIFHFVNILKTRFNAHVENHTTKTLKAIKAKLDMIVDYFADDSVYHKICRKTLLKLKGNLK